MVSRFLGQPNAKCWALIKYSVLSLFRGFPPAASLCLLDVVQWLLAHCGRPQTECRHKSIELFYKFVPLLPGIVIFMSYKLWVLLLPVVKEMCIYLKCNFI